jgi:hypothetical protein
MTSQKKQVCLEFSFERCLEPDSAEARGAIADAASAVTSAAGSGR